MYSFLDFNLKKITLCFIFLFFFQVHQSAANEKKRLIILESMSVPVVLEHSKWFMHEFEKPGYVNNEEVSLSVLNAGGGRQRAGQLLKQEAQKGKIDCVITNATLATQSAVKFFHGTNVPFMLKQVKQGIYS